MCLIFYTILILVFFFVHDGRGQKKSRFPFPTLIYTKDSDIGKPVFTFEGVNYDLLPQHIVKRDFRNCYEEYTRCTRFLTYVNPVCGYHTYHKDVWSYYSICELDLESCKDMKRRLLNMHGIDYRWRGVYFLGEGHTCDIFNRRIAEGILPRDIRDSLKDASNTINGMKSNYDVVTTAIDLQYDSDASDYVQISEFDYGDNIY